MREWGRRLWYLLNRRRLERELQDEMAFHREMAAREGGIPVGNELRLREEARDVWGFLWLDHISQDIRHAWRVMRRSPSFTCTAVLVLAVGIGATVATFSAFNVVALRTLPVREPETLVRFERQSPTRGATEVPYAATEFYRSRTRALSAVLTQTTTRLHLDGTDRPLPAAFVSANFFEELGAHPLSGRLFHGGDHHTAEPVVVFSHTLWTTQFGAAADVVGQSVRINGVSAKVIGVARREFSGLGGTPQSLWLLLPQRSVFLAASNTPYDGDVMFWGRLANGTPAHVADAELTQLAAEFLSTRPDLGWKDERLVSTPAGRAQLESMAAAGLVVALATLILCASCANLGGLMLAQGAARHREMALRSAIGAGTRRLVAQLMTESLFLAAIGGVAGLLVGSLVFAAVLRWTDAPPWFSIVPDWRVITFAISVSALSAVMFGLAPALQAARRSFTRRQLWRSVLIGTQVTASAVLLIVAGLLVRALSHPAAADPGFDVHHTLVVEPALEEYGFTPARAAAFVTQLQARAAAIPGVRSTTVTSTPPLGGLRVQAIVEAGGHPLEVFIHQVDAQYLSTMGITLLRGRDLRPSEPDAIVVSEVLANRRWPGIDALGQTLTIGTQVHHVVGISRTARSLSPRDPDTAELYRLARPADASSLSVIVRANGPSDALLAPLMTVADDIDSTVRPRVYLLTDRFAEHTADLRRSAAAASALGLIALGVACLGVMGLVAYAVAQRTKDIGIRIALGARPAEVIWSVVTPFAQPVIWGIAVGFLMAGGLAQLLRRELYGISAVDPLTYLAATGIFVIAVALAAVVPARRVLRVNPLSALRMD